MGAAAARGEVGGNFLFEAVGGVAGVFAFGEQVVHGCPHRGICSKKAEFKEESDPIGAFIAFVQCTHRNFFPRGWALGDKTIYSRGEWGLLSVDSCIEHVKGLYGLASPRRHGGTERFEGTALLLEQTAREKWATQKNANGFGGMCVGSHGGVIGITKAGLAIRFKRVRAVGAVIWLRFARLIVDS